MNLSADAEMTRMLIREQPLGPVQEVVRQALKHLGRPLGQAS